ncbi:TGS domain-containing protein [Candidatus Pacearchaeota archaeon]|nr:TGS domain-containing protein [Candidatus Pacearchaeota archaeon]
MPINAHPEYVNAEKEYHQADTDVARLKALELMIKHVPKHKGAEKLRKNLRTRYKKFKSDQAKAKKGKKGKKGIKKSEMQAVLIGMTNSGKSSILKTLTNAHPSIASYGFTTQNPEIGTMNYEGCDIQIVDLPPIASEHFDKGIINNADTILLVVEKIHEIEEVKKEITNKRAKQIIIFNKTDLYDKNTKRKITATLKSKRYNHILMSTFTNEGIEDLKKKILKSFPIIRIYTRHPGKKEKLDDKPVILKPHSTLRDVAEKILHGYSKKVKYAKITGPSSKFAGQKVGLKHVVKDKDLVEFFTE